MVFFLGWRGATNEEANNRVRNIGTGFSDLGRFKDDNITVLRGVQEDKDEDVSPLVPGLGYRYKTAAWL